MTLTIVEREYAQDLQRVTQLLHYDAMELVGHWRDGTQDYIMCVTDESNDTQLTYWLAVPVSSDLCERYLRGEVSLLYLWMMADKLWACQGSYMTVPGPQRGAQVAFVDLPDEIKPTVDSFLPR